MRKNNDILHGPNTGDKFSCCAQLYLVRKTLQKQKFLRKNICQPVFVQKCEPESFYAKMSTGKLRF